MRTDVRAALVAEGTAAARGHPAQVDRGLEAGTRHLWRRVLVVNLTAAVAAVVLFLVLGTGSGQVDLPLAVAPDLTSVSVTTTGMPEHLPLGSAFPLHAQGHYDDGRSRDVTNDVSWTSSRPRVATMAAGTGVLVATGAGTTRVTASIDGHQDSARVTVQAAALVAIVIDPPGARAAATRTVRFTALGIFADGSSHRLRRVHWHPAVGNRVATIDGDGVATARTPGSVQIWATRGEVQSKPVALNVVRKVRHEPAGPLRSIDIAAPGGVIETFTPVQLTVTGTYVDGSQQTPADVRWSTDRADIADVDDSGRLTASHVGRVTVTAVAAGVRGSVTLFVGTPRSLTISPEDLDGCPAGDVTLHATAAYDDIAAQDVSDVAVWGSADPEVATIADGAVLSVVGDGRATITATLAGASDVLDLDCTKSPPPPTPTTTSPTSSGSVTPATKSSPAGTGTLAPSP